MATTYREDGSKKTTKNEGPCPSGFFRDPKTGKCVHCLLYTSDAADDW